MRWVVSVRSSKPPYHLERWDTCMCLMPGLDSLGENTCRLKKSLQYFIQGKSLDCWELKRNFAATAFTNLATSPHPSSIFAGLSAGLERLEEASWDTQMRYGRHRQHTHCNCQADFCAFNWLLNRKQDVLIWLATPLVNTPSQSSAFWF